MSKGKVVVLGVNGHIGSFTARAFAEAGWDVTGMARTDKHRLRGVRFVKGDDSMLSPSHERDTCYIAVHQDRKLDWPVLFREVESVLSAYDGRPHWGKRHEQTAATLEPRYPRWRDFQKLRKRLDPTGAFANEYTDRVLGPVS